MARTSAVSSTTPSVCLGNGNLNRLVSLWDIVREFKVGTLIFSQQRLEHLQDRFERIRDRQHGGIIVDTRTLRVARATLQILSENFHSLGLHLVEAKILGFVEGELSAMHDKNPYLDVSTLGAEIKHMHDLLSEELKRYKFVSVLPDRAVYLCNEKPWGEPVFEKFPTARYDIYQAANCFAVDANTATIFHLMRVAEHGLRALAYDRRIKVHKGPIELASWEEIIKELEKAEDQIKNYQKSHAREAQLAFYHGVMMEFRSFKNVWRNRYMHTRGYLNEDDERHEADRVMHRVEDFMKLLATRIGEGKRTPLIWKRA